MTVQRLAVRVRNTLMPLLTVERELKDPEACAILKSLCQEMLHAYQDTNTKPIIAPGGYVIPPLDVTDSDIKREELPCCGS